MKLALTEANMSGLSLEVLSLVLSNYEELAQEGLGDLGTQALIKHYDVQVKNMIKEVLYLKLSTSGFSLCFYLTSKGMRVKCGNRGNPIALTL